jgi:hypothetical protein
LKVAPEGVFQWYRRGNPSNPSLKPLHPDLFQPSNTLIADRGARDYHQLIFEWNYGLIAVPLKEAGVAKLADAPDLGSGGAILRGSSPLSGISESFSCLGQAFLLRLAAAHLPQPKAPAVERASLARPW